MAEASAKAPEQGKRVWHWMVLVMFVPVIGGLIAYAARKDDRDLASFCLLSSIIHPVVVYFILFYILDFAGLAGYIWPLTVVLGLVLNAWLLKGPLKGNRYRNFLTIFWFSLLGLIYSDYKEFRDNKALRRNAIVFFVVQLVAGVALAGLVLLAGMSFVASQFIGSPFGAGGTCSAELSAGYSVALNAYLGELDRGASIQAEWDALEDIYYRPDCSNLEEFIDVWQKYVEWLDGSHYTAFKAYEAAADSIRSCDPETYSLAMMLIGDDQLLDTFWKRRYQDAIASAGLC